MEKYSVLMSVYYKESPGHFQIAIASMLEQSVPPSDFVLVCDGPLTNELDLVIDKYVAEYPDLFNVIRLSENGGLGPALRIGLEQCKFEYVARMDTDDIAVPDRMEKQLMAFSQLPDASVIGGQISEFVEDPEQIIDYRVVPFSHEDIFKRAATRNPMNHMTVVFRRSHVIAVGSYPDAPSYEDYRLWVVLLSVGMRLYNIPDVCCNVRVGNNLYHRRGGMKYFLNSCKMEQFLRKCGMITIWQMCFNVVIRFLGTVICPTRIRGFLFKKLLRKQSAVNC